MSLKTKKDTLSFYLIQRIASNDTNALTILYNNTSSLVYGFALSIVKNHHLAEDIMQDTYIKIYNSASSYKEDGKLISWILTIVRNMCLMKLRESNNKNIMDESLIHNTIDPFDHYKHVENKMMLEICLNYLNDEERQIVMLYAISGLKHKEISELLDISLSTILSKYNRALKKIRKHMEVNIYD